MPMRVLPAIVAVLAAALLHVTPVHAQSIRTWVSGTGDDANPCALTAPCKTFAGAISKTPAGGEISVWSPGGFGTVTITKSLSINAIGFEAGVLAPNGATGFIINAAPTDAVFINGVVFEGA